MIVNDDLNNLFNQFDEKYAVQVVKHDYKTKFPIKYLGHKNDDYPKRIGALSFYLIVLTQRIKF